MDLSTQSFWNHGKIYVCDHTFMTNGELDFRLGWNGICKQSSTIKPSWPLGKNSESWQLTWYVWVLFFIAEIMIPLVVLLLLAYITEGAAFTAPLYHIAFDGDVTNQGILLFLVSVLIYGTHNNNLRIHSRTQIRTGGQDISSSICYWSYRVRTPKLHI
jgi:hypothetical protein